MRRVRRAIRPALLVVFAVALSVGPASAQEPAAGDTAPADASAAAADASRGPRAPEAPADTLRYGPCPDRLEGPSGAPGVPWADTLAAADSLARGLGADVLDTVPVDRLLRRGDRAAALGRHTTAYAAYAAAARAEGGYESLWKASRAAVDVGQEAGDAAEDWYDVAEAYARRAVEANPGAPEGHFHLSQSLGLVALDAGVRERIRLSEEIRREARAAIEADSSFAGGWHVLGRWHRGVMELSGAGRFFARTFLGGEVLGEASWEDARRFLERAARLEPDRIVHHLELGKVHLERDRPDAARERLRTVLELPPRDYHDCVYRQEARELLDELAG